MRSALALAVVLGLAAVLSLHCGAGLTPDLSYDGSSYVGIAQQIVATRSLPRVEARPPLYPLLIASFVELGHDTALTRLVTLQWIAWLGCVAAVYAIVLGSTSSIAAAALAALLFSTMSGPLRYVHIIYAETFAMFATVATVAAFSFATRSGTPRRALAWSTLAAVLGLAGAYLRPICQLLPALCGILVLLERRRTMVARVVLAAPFAIVILAGLLPWYVQHARTRGGAFFVKGSGLSLVNYLGDRRLLGRFPPEDRQIEDFYRRHFAANPDQPYVSWWETQDDWVAAATPSLAGNFDRLHLFMGATARHVLLANPDYYLERWWETWHEFSTLTEELCGDTSCAAGIVQPFWRRAWPLVGWWIPFAVLVVEGLAFLADGASATTLRLAPIVVYVAIGVANTAIEPWPGQMRYRAPIEGLLLIAVVTRATLIARGLAVRWRGRRRSLAPRAR
jgi:hypothetical protein